MTFKRENRYHVLKVSDVEKAFTHNEKVIMQELLEKLDRYRVEENKKPLNYVVIESDWPEYEPAWRMIESRMNGKPEENSTLTIESELELFKTTGNGLETREQYDLRMIKDHGLDLPAIGPGEIVRLDHESWCKQEQGK